MNTLGAVPGGEVLVYEAADDSAGMDVRWAANLDIPDIMSNIARDIE